MGKTNALHGYDWDLDSRLTVGPLGDLRIERMVRSQPADISPPTEPVTAPQIGLPFSQKSEALPRNGTKDK